MRALPLSLALVVVAASPAATGAAGRPRVAVLDLRPAEGVSAGAAATLTAIAVDEISRGGFDAISQSDIQTLLGFERQKQMLGCGDDSSCLAELGGALGADYVLSGQVGQIGSRYHVSVQLLDARRAKVAARAARFADRDGDRLAEAVQRAVQELIATARPAAPRAAAAGAPPAARSEAGSGQGAWRPGRALAWGTLGAGAALLAGGAAFGLAAKATRDDLRNAWRDPSYAATYDSKRKTIRTYAVLSNVCWAAGAAATGAGGWMLWRSRGAAVAVAPVVGGGEVAVAVGGTF